MITKQNDETRIEYLSRVLVAYMEENPCAAEYWIGYDGAECDGWCLAEDIKNEAEVL